MDGGSVNITSEKFPELKLFNKKAGKKRSIRVGVTVDTPRGIGMVIWRKNDDIEVAVRPDREDELLPCYRYKYKIDDVAVSNVPIDRNDRLYKGAWDWIIQYAIIDNQNYESVKHSAIFSEYEWRIPGKRADRTVSAGYWGSYKYRRYTGVNKHGDLFDFELCLRPAFPVPYGDRILYALGESDGYITDINGNGWIYRRKITNNDINYGICKYAGPQMEDE